jgi:hypothetical protein
LVLPPCSFFIPHSSKKRQARLRSLFDGGRQCAAARGGAIQRLVLSREKVFKNL